MKDEGPYILDWIAYHKMIGVTDFLIYANDCSDLTFDILLELHRMEIIQFRFNHVLKPGVQKSALKRALSEPVVQNADWLMMLDVDEYLNVKIGTRLLRDLIAKHEMRDAISIVWRKFGHAGNIDLSKDAVPMEFTRSETSDVTQHRFFKTIFKNNDKFERMGIHRPYLVEPIEEIDWVLPNGTPIPDEHKHGALHVWDNYGYEVAQINHYALRSIEAFLIKKVRGRPNHMKMDTGLGYWNKFDHNDVEDSSICPLMANALDIKAAYLRESPKLAELQEQTFLKHRAKVDKIIEHSWAQDFVNEILKSVAERDITDTPVVDRKLIK